MRWSWKIGRLVGIDVYMHATFLLLVGFIVVATWVESHNVARTLFGVFFVLVIFGCIVLHELGHALTARRYGIRTRDIVLLPIGGVARLKRMPEDPNQELLVALAGPAVNVLIALGLFAVLAATGRIPTLRQAATISWTGHDFLPSLMAVNVWLVLFNLIPAFPMDGGRVLRALLAKHMDYTEATQRAAHVGQAIAFVFGFLGLFFDPFLLFIALFVWMGASGEAAASRLDLGESGILLGNGASMAISPSLSYPALFKVSCDRKYPHHLGETEQQVFGEFGTQNFEEILFNLRVSRRTCSCFPPYEADLGSLQESYENVRNALIAAVRRVHPQPGDLTEDVKELVSSHLALYKNLFTTNYDLIVFWSIAAKKYVFRDGTGKEKTKQFKDFFWNQEGIFDPADTDVWSGTIGVHFLHGGLHLYRHRDTGATHKHRTLSEPPLSYFENNNDLLPLFVSEGESQGKMRAIRSNEYLSFVYSRFVRHKGDLVVFGQSLKAQFDGHIVDAIGRWPSMDRRQARPPRRPKSRTVAVSIRPNSGRESVRLEKLRILGLFKTDEINVLFYDSNSHPMSSRG